MPVAVPWQCSSSPTFLSGEASVSDSVIIFDGNVHDVYIK